MAVEEPSQLRAVWVITSASPVGGHVAITHPRQDVTRKASFTSVVFLPQTRDLSLIQRKTRI